MRVIHLARKPLSEKSVAANVLKHGTGGLNIDASRIGTGEDKGIWPVTDREGGRITYMAALTHTLEDPVETDTTKGRWPANLILQHRPGCRYKGTKRVKGTSIHGETTATRRSGVHSDAGGHQTIGRVQPVRGFSDKDGMELVAAWDCEPGCPVADLDAQTGDRPVSGAARAGRPAVGGAGTGIVQFGVEEGNGTLHNDSGGASRFFKQVGGESE